MSDPAGEAGNAAVQELFSHLRRPQPSPRSDSASANPFALSSPSPSRSATISARAPTSGISAQGLTSLSPSVGIASPPPPVDQGAPERTASLLNILRLNAGSHSTSAHDQSPSSSRASLPLLHSQQHVRGVSTLDLVGSSMGRPTIHENATPSPPADSGTAGLTSLANPQEYLLQLLNRQQQQQQQQAGAVLSPGTQLGETRSPPVPTIGKSPQTIPSPLPTGTESTSNQAHAASDDFLPSSVSPAQRDSPIRVFGSRESREPTPFDPYDIPKAAKPADKGMFTYVNPFDQLAASSPRNHSPAVGSQPNGQLPQQSGIQMSPIPKPVHTIISQNVEVASPAPLADGRTRVEALMGIGAPTTDAEVVSEALDNVGEQIGKQNNYEEQEAVRIMKKPKKESDQLEETPQPSRQGEDGKDIKIEQEADDEDVRRSLQKLTTANDALPVEDNMDDAAVADDEESSVNGEEYHEVPVFNIPLKPFVAIHLTQSDPPDLSFREPSIADIARVKKEFDQIDRNLATASNEYIVYSTPKKPYGVRVIQQDDGRDRQLFKENDPIFNVTISYAPGKTDNGVETVIATGVSGTVYWSVIRSNGIDQSLDDHVSKYCLIFPPSPAQDDNTSGGQLKTRAKKSNRHPEFFAIGRGKTIQVIFPFQALKSDFVRKNSTVDTDAYFKDRSLKINTGKAGKDFAFSEDDTVLASLDKAGRLRFWDVRDLVHEDNASASKLAPIEINVPIMTVSTAHVNDKAWPTSVLFVDKSRPYVRGFALRYVIVGMKQNHTLQLWDLSLGKVVQELNLPHSNESDAICSVAYHPATGIVVVGHPTRNSVYFIHLSAPKYNLQGISQAKYLQAIVSKNPSLPKPDSTAIMSGIREYSFASKGQIRSLDLLSSVHATGDKKTDDEKAQFELYVMHSKGVACLNIKKADLGWSAENKVITKIDGEQAGLVLVKELAELRPIVDSEMSSVNGDAIGSVKGLSSHARSPLPEQLILKEEREANTASETPVNGTPSTIKPERRKKKRPEPPSEGVADDVPPPAPVPPTASSQPSASRNASSTQTSSRKELKATKKEHQEEHLMSKELTTASSDGPSVSLSVSGDFIQREYTRIEQGMRTAFSHTLNVELEALRKRIDEDRRVQDAASAAKQDAILRLVSSSLTENVDKALDRIVSSNIQKLVLPQITQVTEKALTKIVQDWLQNGFQQTMASQLKVTVPEALGNAMGSQQLLQALTDGVTNKISKRLDREMQTSVFPHFQSMAVSAATNLASETEQRVAQQLSKAELKAQDDASKIERLTVMAGDLLEITRTMSESMSGMRSEILALQEEVLHLHASAPSTALVPTAGTSILENPEDVEMKEIIQLIETGAFEEGTIRWLQSPFQSQFFNKFFVKFDPAYLQQLPSLVTLSVGAAVVTTLEDHVAERLHWLGSVLTYIDPNESDAKQVAPQIMDVIVQRLESRYMSLAEVDPADPRLRQIPPLTKAAKEVKTLAQS